VFPIQMSVATRPMATMAASAMSTVGHGLIVISVGSR
jgi:hypothetical protein